MLNIIKYSVVIFVFIVVWIKYSFWLATAFFAVILFDGIRKRNFIKKYAQKLDKIDLGNFTHFKKIKIHNPKNILKIKKDNFEFICFDIDLFHNVMINFENFRLSRFIILRVFLDFFINLASSQRERKKITSTAFLVKVGKKFPSFLLSPKTFLENFKKTKKSEILLKNFPQFSKKYFLRGKNRKEIRKFLTPKIINFLLRKKIKYHLEFKDSYLLFFPIARGFRHNIHPINFPKIIKKLVKIL